MFIATGVAFAIGALNYKFGSSARPGPGYFPFGLGMLQALLGAFILLRAITFQAEVKADLDGEFTTIKWRPLLLILLSILAFGLALPKLGLAVALPLLIAISTLAGEEFNWKEVAVNCVVLTAGSWLIFIKGLGLSIPLIPPFLSGN